MKNRTQTNDKSSIILRKIRKLSLAIFSLLKQIAINGSIIQTLTRRNRAMSKYNPIRFNFKLKKTHD